MHESIVACSSRPSDMLRWRTPCHAACSALGCQAAGRGLPGFAVLGRTMGWWLTSNLAGLKKWSSRRWTGCPRISGS